MSVIKNPKAFAIVCGLLLFCFGIPPASAQSDSCVGVVHGTILSNDGRPAAQSNLILEPTGDFDLVLPKTKTDDQGHYRFEHICSGTWSVFLDLSPSPASGKLLYSFLYGTKTWPQVEISDRNLDGELDVTAPPKPAFLRLRLTDSHTGAEIRGAEITLRVTRKQAIIYSRFIDKTQDDFFFALPPNQAVKVRVTAKGYRTWKGSARQSNVFRAASGVTLAADVSLSP
jgi:hypothetical protein